MSDTLTPDQLAELVVTAKRGGHAGDARAHHRRARRVRPLDFSRPMKLSPPELRRVEGTHTRFCRDASIRLSSELRSPIELEVLDLVQLTWASAMRGISSQTILAVATTTPADASILICFDEQLLLVTLERLLGGSPGEMPASRALTEIDMALAQRVLGGVVETLSAAWHEFLGLRLSLHSIESQQGNVELVPPSEPTVAVTIEGRDQAGHGTISLLAPYTAIAAGGRLSTRSGSGEEPSRPDGEAELMRSAIGGIGVELRAEVGSVELSLGEVLALREGDLVRLGTTGNEGLFGGGGRLHRVRPGRAGSRRAVQIIGSEEDAR